MYLFPLVVKPDILTFQVKFDFEGQGQSPPKTIGILTKVFCTSGPYLMIPAWTGLESSCGQASDWHTDGQTDASNDNTRRPKLASGNKDFSEGVQQIPMASHIGSA